MGEGQAEGERWDSAITSSSSSISIDMGSWLESHFSCTGFVGDPFFLAKNLLFVVAPIGRSSFAATLRFRSDKRETPGPDCPTGVGRSFVFGAFDPGRQLSSSE